MLHAACTARCVSGNTRLLYVSSLTPSGSHCAGLFSTMVLGGSSSAPNLQDYAHAHRKKLTSSGFLDGMCKHAHTPSNGESPSLILRNPGVLSVFSVGNYWILCCSHWNKSSFCSFVVVQMPIRFIYDEKPTLQQTQDLFGNLATQMLLQEMYAMNCMFH